MLRKIKMRLFRLGTGMILLSFLVGGTACSETAQLTPAQKQLFSAWDLVKEIRMDYREKDSDKVLALLTPELAQKYQVRKKLEELFLGLEITRLHLEVDQGTWEPQSNRMIYKAHWTFSGRIKQKGPPVFKTGECQIVVVMGEANAPSLIESITGDNFLLMALPPGKVPVNSGQG